MTSFKVFSKYFKAITATQNEAKSISNYYFNIDALRKTVAGECLHLLRSPRQPRAQTIFTRNLKFPLVNKMETENFAQLAIAWKAEMCNKLWNTEISHVSDISFDKNIWDPNLVMKERRKMEHGARIHQIKFIQLPKETVFVEASKLIRKENSEALTHVKEERMINRAIQSLEKSFSEHRNSKIFSLIEFERLNKRKESARFTKNACTFAKNKQIDSENFYKNFQKIYKSIYCQTSDSNNRGETEAGCRDLDKSKKNLKNLRDKSLKWACRIFPYDGDVMNLEKDGEKLVCPESTENESGSCDCNDEEEKVYPSPNESPCNCNCGGETASQKSEESEAGKNSNVSYKFQLSRYWKAWRKLVLRTRIDQEKLMRMNKIDLFLKRLTTSVCNDNSCASKNPRLCAVKNSNPATRKTSRRKPINSASMMETDKQLDTIEDELNKSTVEAYEHLRRGLKTFHPKLRPKAKVLATFPNIDKKTHPRTEIKRNYPVPSFIVRMENRYKERKKRWEDIERRKRQIQAEKEQIEKEREEERMKMEELRKKEKLEELIKKREERKKAEEERERRKQELKKKIRLAQEHYVKYLIKRVGFEPWKNLVEMRCAQLQEADCYSRMQTSKSYFKHWRDYALMQIKQKCDKADAMYNHILLKRSFTQLVNDYNETVKKLQVALDWWDAKFTEKVFKLWLEYIHKERLENLQKEEVARSHCIRLFTDKYFKIWKKFPEYMRNEKEREVRKRMLQRKVQEFLPDYQPAFVSEI